MHVHNNSLLHLCLINLLSLSLSLSSIRSVEFITMQKANNNGNSKINIYCKIYKDSQNMLLVLTIHRITIYVMSTITSMLQDPHSGTQWFNIEPVQSARLHC